MYRRILIPLDGSELAECVLPHAEAFMAAFPESRIVFVRVVEPLAASVREESVLMAQELEEIETARRSSAEQYLRNVTARFKGKETETDFEVLVGKVADRLIEYVEGNAIDLILIATHGRSGVSRWVRGSIADRILRSSKVPVFMVRAPGVKGEA